MRRRLFIYLLSYLFLFSVSIAFASAANLEITSAGNISATHSATGSSSFVLSNTHLTSNITNLSCLISINSWSTSCPVPSMLNNKTNQSVSFSVSVPQYTAPSAHSGTISVNGILAEGSTNVSTQAQFNLNVTAGSSISISWLQEPSDIYQGESKVIGVNVINTGNIALNMNLNANVTKILSNFSSFNLSPSASKALNFTINAPASGSIGTYTARINATGTNETYNLATTVTAAEKSFDILYSFCSERQSGDISLDSIENEKDILEGTFEPLNSFDVEARVRNSGSEINYAYVEAVIVSEGSIISDSKVDEKIKLKENDYSTITLTMKIPSEIKEGANYLYVKAYDSDNKGNCQQKKLRLDVEKEPYKVIPFEIKIEPSRLNCSETFKTSGIVINTGSHDEDKVKIAYSDAFGKTDSKVFNNIKEGKKSSMFSFENTVLSDSTTGIKTITLGIFYDYDDVSGNYGSNENFNYDLSVIGNCYREIKSFSINVQPIAYALKATDIAVLIKNDGNVNATYKVSADGDWATISSVEPAELSLGAGEEKKVVLKIIPKEGTAPGIHNINLKVEYAGTSETKTIPVNIAQKSNETSSFLNIFNDIGEKVKTSSSWLIIDIVLVLLILILIVILIFKSRDKFPWMFSMLKRKFEAEEAVKKAEAKAVK